MILSGKLKFMHRHLTVLLILLALPCLSFVSTNVPLDHWSYDAVDKLAGLGLIDSDMLTTRPVSRYEMARHIAEADEKFQRLDSKNELVREILDRLKKEFRQELAAMGAIEGEPAKDFIKPVEDPYIKYVYARSKPEIENIRGDRFDKYSNYRAGFAARGQLFDIAGFYLHPEYPYSDEKPDQDMKLIEAYGKLAIGKVEIEAGKDSLWWGPGYNGSLLMSNNAEPFKMIKLSTPGPVELPWIFRGLGPFKAVWFLTQLEKDRAVPEAKLTGMRINFKPHPAVELGMSRAIMFGGFGSLGLRDYWDIFLATKENRPGKLDNNQLAGYDASVLLPVDWILPAKSVKLYGDFIGEDEAGGLPSNFGKLYGAKVYDIFRTGRTDLIIEYANNHVPDKPNVFYSHHIYTDGYTYKDRIIGHHMGTDSKNLYLRLSHYLSSDIIAGIEYENQTSNLSLSPKPTLERIGFDLRLFGPDNWEVKTGYRYENATGDTFVDNQIFFLQLTYDF